ncbi:SpoIIE family protein phosphatase [Streptoalloteichus hindustanus]|uniref:protein-serine/threonine phosphatase n=1 Tax=Streptoalloteichus hindustanus TaxID=2017 RepID=A0A1M5AGW0_STRHI|nr:SpoIIE family protein phosphatase [Streptoalloteichus hindustanus]SHF29374.1 PAS domain S-box-containing protein [Streptoalloteichus hindustanus]
MSSPGLAALSEGIASCATPVLVVDLATRTVVETNEAAAALAPGVRLPVDVDAWGKAAGLTDVDGRPLDDPWSPLHRAAGGQRVAGEAVTLGGSERDVLWLTSVPLPSQIGPLGAAMVLLVRLAEPEGLADKRLELVRGRALAGTDVSVVISDARRHDYPVLWVNPAFTRMTGYEPHEVIGRSVNVLQGRHTDPQSVDRVRRALRERRPVTEVLLNYRKDGVAFWNELTISPVQDATGQLTHFVAVQSDVTERVLLEHQRQAALAAAEEDRHHLRLLTEATAALSATLDTSDAARRLAQLVVPALADYCCVDLLDEPGAGAATRVAASHRRGDQVSLLHRQGELVGPRIGGPDRVSRVLSGGRAVLLPDVYGETAEPRCAAELAELDLQLRPLSMIIVPLRARGRVLGALTLCTERPYGRRYADSDLDIASDLASRVALAVDNARLYAREHEAALTLQQSLLPAPPPVPGLAVAARYLVGAGEAEVGGDWYDVLQLPDGAVGLVVGDVVGHDLRAAAAMGQIRGLLRACAWEGSPPGVVLDRSDEMVQGLGVGAMATAVCLRLEPRDGSGLRRLRFANAGHPAPLLRTPDGNTEWLVGRRSPLLGAVLGGPRGEDQVDCPDGSLLLLYTDGIIELRGADPDERTARLREVVASLAADCPVEEVCDRVLTAMHSDLRQDDVVLLAVRVLG